MSDEQILVVDTLAVRFGEREIFNNVTFHVCRGTKYIQIGRAHV